MSRSTAFKSSLGRLTPSKNYESLQGTRSRRNDKLKKRSTAPSMLGHKKSLHNGALTPETPSSQRLIQYSQAPATIPSDLKPTLQRPSSPVQLSHLYLTHRSLLQSTPIRQPKTRSMLATTASFRSLSSLIRIASTQVSTPNSIRVKILRR